jgi:predicted nucleic acid-binding protein
MAGWLPFPLRVTITGVLRACRDPNDDMVLECAVVAGAQVIVSGDKDLLALDPYNGIRIVSPAEFLVLESQR